MLQQRTHRTDRQRLIEGIGAEVSQLTAIPLFLKKAVCVQA